VPVFSANGREEKTIKKMKGKRKEILVGEHCHK
jgi:hypothetical protein